MSGKTRKERQKQASASAGTPIQIHPDFLPLAVLAAAVLVFYWIPIASARASVHRDAVDVHYSALKYFASSMRAGLLPSWTPYVFSGFPFLSDPQTGVWYPLNWPLLLLGVTPGALQASLALHCLLAAWGMYFLALRFISRREAAVLAGILYAFSGFFAAHSSHVGMFQTAAWLPWLLFALSRAFDTRRAAWVIGAGTIAGAMILAGHFQTALYSCFAAALFAIAWAIRNRRQIRTVALCLLPAFAAGTLLSSIQTIPAYELVRNSIRARAVYTHQTNAPLAPSALVTLLYADALGAVSGSYRGPEDITQFYFYAGVALLPLAMLGLRNPSARLPALILLIPSIWYSPGPGAGFYSALARLPGFANVRAPVHIWFVCALSLALLAAAGMQVLAERFRNRQLVWAVLIFCFADVYYWNSLSNPLAYERLGFQERYGQNLDFFRTRIAPRIPALARFHLPAPNPIFGPLNHPLDARVETTYGYNPLQLAAYADYMAMAAANPRLLDTLGVKYYAIPGQKGIHENAGALPRAHFPKRVIAVRDAAAAKRETSRLDTAQAAVLVASSAPAQDASATAGITEYGETAFRIRYRSAAQSLLRIGIPFYPGWRASIGGRDYPVVPVDYALSGVIVPPGEHDIVLEFHTPGFRVGAWLSALAVLVCAWVVVMDLRRARVRLEAAAHK